jgi:hypothetical protein
MYILVQIVPRAETFDTLLYYTSELRTPLEEIILSIYEEVLENRNMFGDITDLQFKMKVNQYMDRFHIIQVPYLED